MNNWEKKATALKAQFGEQLWNMMKILQLTNIMLMNIQQHIYSTAEKDTQYTTVNGKVRTMNQIRLGAKSGAAAMDTGEVGIRMEDAGSGYWGN